MQPSGGVQDSIRGLKLGREEEVEGLTGIYRLISRKRQDLSSCVSYLKTYWSSTVSVKNKHHIVGTSHIFEIYL